MKIAYVVLHYLATQDTIECVDSILNNIHPKKPLETWIIVVDNGSPNDSYIKLKDAFKEYRSVKQIRSDKNLGFAKGNNLGFQYAKYQLKADFIVLLNNDTVINQENFSDMIIKKYEERKYAVLGPDIITADGCHQNPGRAVCWTLKKLRLFRAKKFVQYMLSHIDIFDRFLTINKESFAKEKLQKDALNVHLHGACLIFSPEYIRKFDGLYDKTFLYMEEDILKLRADHFGYMMMYTPELILYHKEDMATKAVAQKSIVQKKIFYKNLLYSSNEYMQLKKTYSSGRKIRSLLEKIAQHFKGFDYKIDSEIPLSYLISFGKSRSIMLMRGFIKQGRKSHHNVFCGKKVTLKCKKKIEFNDGVTLQDNVYIDALSKEGVWLGSGSSIGSGSIIRCTGNIKELGKGFHLGNNSSMADNCFVGATGGVWIGDDVIAGQNVRFHSSNHIFNNGKELIRKQGITAEGIRIGNNCWIGAGAVFCDGVTIGDGCVVGADAVLTKDFPSNSIIAGVPAKIIGTRGK